MRSVAKISTALSSEAISIDDWRWRAPATVARTMRWIQASRAVCRIPTLVDGRGRRSQGKEQCQLHRKSVGRSAVVLAIGLSVVPAGGRPARGCGRADGKKVSVPRPNEGIWRA